MGILNIPNTLTMTRIVLIPLFVTSVIYNRYDYALSLFVVAALTDMFDGLIAGSKAKRHSLAVSLIQWPINSFS